MGMVKSLVTEICELYRQGLDESTIASILNMPVQDVGYVIKEYAKEFAE
jgi:orotate phosphoribosyltransferase-like protein